MECSASLRADGDGQSTHPSIHLVVHRSIDRSIDRLIDLMQHTFPFLTTLVLAAVFLAATSPSHRRPAVILRCLALLPMQGLVHGRDAHGVIGENSCELC